MFLMTMLLMTNVVDDNVADDDDHDVVDDRLVLYVSDCLQLHNIFVCIILYCII